MCGAELKPLPEGMQRVARALQDTLIDRELLRFDEIWAAAGHPHGVFKLQPADLVHLTGAPVVDVTAGETA
jgi:prolyl-tRNA editing enzyme YbaK/EbsC (Cys-tRNA(Pro) deacylase)